MLLAPFSVQAQPLDPISCLIEPREIVELSTPVAGIIAEVAVEQGDVVQAGDLVARLDSRLEEISRDLARARAEDPSDILGLEARIAFLDEQAARTRTLASRNAVSDTAAREAELEAEVARQELARARLSKVLAGLELAQSEALLAQKRLVAPVTGVVTERLLDPGEYSDGQAHVATLARIDILRVEAFAPIAYFPQLAIGQTVTVTPEAPLDSPREATIDGIDRVFDAATATFGLRMEIDNSDLALPAGLRCTLTFP